ncbi:uncharacterized protein VTP21DRAFT_1462 [Calcarisporiella thermophila]|uniref:uncharacterized protein n=1 Tax=Calcarisporiella thermophila TaxID=911321 RepID=UPI0037431B24
MPTVDNFDYIRNHYISFRNYLGEEASQDDVFTNAPSTARDKLTKLTRTQFFELSTDVYDELLRRADGNMKASSLPMREEYHPRRNQARNKLATLPKQKFRDLISDILFELTQRFPDLAEKKQNTIHEEREPPMPPNALDHIPSGPVRANAHTYSNKSLPNVPDLPDFPMPESHPPYLPSMFPEPTYEQPPSIHPAHEINKLRPSRSNDILQKRSSTTHPPYSDSLVQTKSSFPVEVLPPGKQETQSAEMFPPKDRAFDRDPMHIRELDLRANRKAMDLSATLDSLMADLGNMVETNERDPYHNGELRKDERKLSAHAPFYVNPKSLNRVSGMTPIENPDAFTGTNLIYIQATMEVPTSTDYEIRISAMRKRISALENELLTKTGQPFQGTWLSDLENQLRYERNTNQQLTSQYMHLQNDYDQLLDKYYQQLEVGPFADDVRQEIAALLDEVKDLNRKNDRLRAEREQDAYTIQQLTKEFAELQVAYGEKGGFPGVSGE